MWGIRMTDIRRTNDTIVKNNINYFNFTKVDNQYLITNDSGNYMFLPESDFNLMLNGNLNENLELKSKLSNNNFIIEGNKEIFVDKMSQKVRNIKSYLFEATQLHIFVLTIECNQSCVYCQASAMLPNSNCNKMSYETAKNAVDIAFMSPSRNLSFEFQGGEPLLNFEVLKFIVLYANDKNKDGYKNIIFNLVSNLTMINTEMIKFLVNYKVSICTSIDGPSGVHNINRPWGKKSALEHINKSINEINRYCSDNNLSDYRVQAIQTTTKYSFVYYKEIVDEYIKQGMNSIFIRPLTPLGTAKDNWNEIGYSAEEFNEFYKNALDYIIELNKNGIELVEGHASLFLKRILSPGYTNYMELRSPCGASIGQMAYNYDGNIFTCDEGRMLAEMGDNMFMLGNVRDNTYADLICSPVCKSVCIASCTETIPGCMDCVYSPYCGTCPVYNYDKEKSLFSKMPANYKCKIYKGILDTIFNKLRENNESTMNVFRKWIS
jgi:His-Xaa-Ser system radical SAM maturase HxsB